MSLVWYYKLIRKEFESNRMCLLKHVKYIFWALFKLLSIINSGMWLLWLLIMLNSVSQFIFSGSSNRRCIFQLGAWIELNLLVIVPQSSQYPSLNSTQYKSTSSIFLFLNWTIYTIITCTRLGSYDCIFSLYYYLYLATQHFISLSQRRRCRVPINNVNYFSTGI